MDWSHLKVVLAVYRMGSLTRAASHLGTDQTTVGRRLSALEEALGCHLFLRAKSGFVPTEKGLIAIDHARTVEQTVEGMRDALTDVEDGASGVVRILGNNWMLERLSLLVFPRLLESNPNLKLRLSGRLPPVPMHAEATISLWFDAPPVPSELAIPIFRLPYAAYRLHGGNVNKDHWVHFLDDDAVGPSFTRQTKRKLGRSTSVRLTATDASILLNATRAGMGNSILPACIGDDDNRLERIESVNGINRVLHVHLNPYTAKTRRVQTVLSELLETGPAVLGALNLKSRHELLPN